jgi:hypothetical protein
MNKADQMASNFKRTFSSTREGVRIHFAGLWSVISKIFTYSVPEDLRPGIRYRQKEFSVGSYFPSPRRRTTFAFFVMPWPWMNGA